MEAPVMLVLRKEQALFKDNSGLKGIKCRWFTKDGLMQEAVFNTKDLIKVEKWLINIKQEELHRVVFFKK